MADEDAGATGGDEGGGEGGGGTQLGGGFFTLDIESRVGSGVARDVPIVEAAADAMAQRLAKIGQAAAASEAVVRRLTQALLDQGHTQASANASVQGTLGVDPSTIDPRFAVNKQRQDSAEKESHEARARRLLIERSHNAAIIEQTRQIAQEARTINVPGRGSFNVDPTGNNERSLRAIAIAAQAARIETQALQKAIVDSVAARAQAAKESQDLSDRSTPSSIRRRIDEINRQPIDRVNIAGQRLQETDVNQNSLRQLSAAEGRYQALLANRRSVYASIQRQAYETQGVTDRSTSEAIQQRAREVGQRPTDRVTLAGASFQERSTNQNDLFQLARAEGQYQALLRNRQNIYEGIQRQQERSTASALEAERRRSVTSEQLYAYTAAAYATPRGQEPPPTIYDLGTAPPGSGGPTGRAPGGGRGPRRGGGGRPGGPASRESAIAAARRERDAFIEQAGAGDEELLATVRQAFGVTGPATPKSTADQLLESRAQAEAQQTALQDQINAATLKNKDIARQLAALRAEIGPGAGQVAGVVGGLLRQGRELKAQRRNLAARSNAIGQSGVPEPGFTPPPRPEPADIQTAYTGVYGQIRAMQPHYEAAATEAQVAQHELELQSIPDDASGTGSDVYPAPWMLDTQGKRKKGWTDSAIIRAASSYKSTDGVMASAYDPEWWSVAESGGSGGWAPKAWSTGAREANRRHDRPFAEEEERTEPFREVDYIGKNRPVGELRQRAKEAQEEHERLRQRFEQLQQAREAIEQMGAERGMSREHLEATATAQLPPAEESASFYVEPLPFDNFGEAPQAAAPVAPTAAPAPPAPTRTEGPPPPVFNAPKVGTEEDNLAALQAARERLATLQATRNTLRTSKKARASKAVVERLSQVRKEIEIAQMDIAKLESLTGQGARGTAPRAAPAQTAAPQAGLFEEPEAGESGGDEEDFYRQWLSEHESSTDPAIQDQVREMREWLGIPTPAAPTGTPTPPPPPAAPTPPPPPVPAAVAQTTEPPQDDNAPSLADLRAAVDALVARRRPTQPAPARSRRPSAQGPHGMQQLTDEGLAEALASRHETLNELEAKRGGLERGSPEHTALLEASRRPGQMAAAMFREQIRRGTEPRPDWMTDEYLAEVHARQIGPAQPPIQEEFPAEDLAAPKYPARAQGTPAPAEAPPIPQPLTPVTPVETPAPITRDEPGPAVPQLLDLPPARAPTPSSSPSRSAAYAARQAAREARARQIVEEQARLNQQVELDLQPPPAPPAPPAPPRAAAPVYETSRRDFERQLEQAVAEAERVAAEKRAQEAAAPVTTPAETLPARPVTTPPPPPRRVPSPPRGRSAKDQEFIDGLHREAELLPREIEALRVQLGEIRTNNPEGGAAQPGGPDAQPQALENLGKLRDLRANLKKTVADLHGLNEQVPAKLRYLLPTGPRVTAAETTRPQREAAAPVSAFAAEKIPTLDEFQAQFKKGKEEQEAEGDENQPGRALGIAGDQPGLQLGVSTENLLPPEDPIARELVLRRASEGRVAPHVRTNEGPLGSATIPINAEVRAAIAAAQADAAAKGRPEIQTPGTFRGIFRNNEIAGWAAMLLGPGGQSIISRLGSGPVQRHPQGLAGIQEFGGQLIHGYSPGPRDQIKGGLSGENIPFLPPESVPQVEPPPFAEGALETPEAPAPDIKFGRGGPSDERRAALGPGGLPKAEVLDKRADESADVVRRRMGQTPIPEYLTGPGVSQEDLQHVIGVIQGTTTRASAAQARQRQQLEAAAQHAREQFDVVRQAYVARGGRPEAVRDPTHIRLVTRGNEALGYAARFTPPNQPARYVGDFPGVPSAPEGASTFNEAAFKKIIEDSEASYQEFPIPTAQTGTPGLPGPPATKEELVEQFIRSGNTGGYSSEQEPPQDIEGNEQRFIFRQLLDYLTATQTGRTARTQRAGASPYIFSTPYLKDAQYAAEQRARRAAESADDYDAEGNLLPSITLQPFHKSTGSRTSAAFRRAYMETPEGPRGVTIQTHVGGRSQYGSETEMRAAARGIFGRGQGEELTDEELSAFTGINAPGAAQESGDADTLSGPEVREGQGVDYADIRPKKKGGGKGSGAKRGPQAAAPVSTPEPPDATEPDKAEELAEDRRWLAENEGSRDPKTIAAVAQMRAWLAARPGSGPSSTGQPGFATGGGFRVGDQYGQLGFPVDFMASPGERVRVAPPVGPESEFNVGGTGGPDTEPVHLVEPAGTQINITPEMPGPAKRQGRLTARTRAQIAQAAIAAGWLTVKDKEPGKPQSEFMSRPASDFNQLGFAAGGAVRPRVSDEKSSASKMTATQARKALEEMGGLQLRPASAIASEFIGPAGTRMPAYMQGVIDTIQRQGALLHRGELSEGQVATGFLASLASIREHARPAERVHERYGAFPEDVLSEQNGAPVVRPEDLISSWLQTPEGRQALIGLSHGGRGYAESQAAIEGFQKGLPFGFPSVGRAFSPPKPGGFSLQNLAEATGAVNAAGRRGSSAEIQDVFSRFAGIGVGKTGFLGQWLGHGELPTVDSNAAQTWLGTEAGLLWQKASGDPRSTFGVDLRSGIQSGQFGLHDAGYFSDVARNVAPAAFHHAVFDAKINARTTHTPISQALEAAGLIGTTGLPGFATGGEFTVGHELSMRALEQEARERGSLLPHEYRLGAGELPLYPVSRSGTKRYAEMLRAEGTLGEGQQAYDLDPATVIGTHEQALQIGNALRNIPGIGALARLGIQVGTPPAENAHGTYQSSQRLIHLDPRLFNPEYTEQQDYESWTAQTRGRRALPWTSTIPAAAPVLRHELGHAIDDVLGLSGHYRRRVNLAPLGIENVTTMGAQAGGWSPFLGLPSQLTERQYPSQYALQSSSKAFAAADLAGEHPSFAKHAEFVAEALAHYLSPSHQRSERVNPNMIGVSRDLDPRITEASRKSLSRLPDYLANARNLDYFRSFHQGTLEEEREQAARETAYRGPRLPGFATGGEFTVEGGEGGVDDVNVAFRASRGERVKITPAAADPQTGGLPGFATGGRISVGERLRGFFSRGPDAERSPAAQQAIFDRQRQTEIANRLTITPPPTDPAFKDRYEQFQESVGESTPWPHQLGEVFRSLRAGPDVGQTVTPRVEAASIAVSQRAGLQAAEAQVKARQAAEARAGYPIPEIQTQPPEAIAEAREAYARSRAQLWEARVAERQSGIGGGGRAARAVNQIPPPPTVTGPASTATVDYAIQARSLGEKVAAFFRGLDEEFKRRLKQRQDAIDAANAAAAAAAPPTPPPAAAAGGAAGGGGGRTPPPPTGTPPPPPPTGPRRRITAQEREAARFQSLSEEDQDAEIEGARAGQFPTGTFPKAPKKSTSIGTPLYGRDVRFGAPPRDPSQQDRVATVTEQNIGGLRAEQQRLYTRITLGNASSDDIVHAQNLAKALGDIKSTSIEDLTTSTAQLGTHAQIAKGFWEGLLGAFQLTPTNIIRGAAALAGFGLGINIVAGAARLLRQAVVDASDAFEAHQQVLVNLQTVYGTAAAAQQGFSAQLSRETYRPQQQIEAALGSLPAQQLVQFGALKEPQVLQATAAAATAERIRGIPADQTQKVTEDLLGAIQEGGKVAALNVDTTNQAVERLSGLGPVFESLLPEQQSLIRNSIALQQLNAQNNNVQNARQGATTGPGGIPIPAQPGVAAADRILNSLGISSGGLALPAGGQGTATTAGPGAIPGTGAPGNTIPLQGNAAGSYVQPQVPGQGANFGGFPIPGTNLPASADQRAQQAESIAQARRTAGFGQAAINDALANANAARSGADAGAQRLTPNIPGTANQEASQQLNQRFQEQLQAGPGKFLNALGTASVQAASGLLTIFSGTTEEVAARQKFEVANTQAATQLGYLVSDLNGVVVVTDTFTGKIQEGASAQDALNKISKTAQGIYEANAKATADATSAIVTLGPAAESAAQSISRQADAAELAARGITATTIQRLGPQIGQAREAGAVEQLIGAAPQGALGDPTLIRRQAEAQAEQRVLALRTAGAVAATPTAFGGQLDAELARAKEGLARAQDPVTKAFADADIARAKAAANPPAAEQPVAEPPAAAPQAATPATETPPVPGLIGAAERTAQQAGPPAAELIRNVRRLPPVGGTINPPNPTDAGSTAGALTGRALSAIGDAIDAYGRPDNAGARAPGASALVGVKNLLGGGIDPNNAANSFPPPAPLPPPTTASAATAQSTTEFARFQAQTKEEADRSAAIQAGLRHVEPVTPSGTTGFDPILEALNKGLGDTISGAITTAQGRVTDVSAAHAAATAGAEEARQREAAAKITTAPQLANEQLAAPRPYISPEEAAMAAGASQEQVIQQAEKRVDLQQKLNDLEKAETNILAQVAAKQYELQQLSLQQQKTQFTIGEIDNTRQRRQLQNQEAIDLIQIRTLNVQKDAIPINLAAQDIQARLTVASRARLDLQMQLNQAQIAALPLSQAVETHNQNAAEAVALLVADSAKGLTGEPQMSREDRATLEKKANDEIIQGLIAGGPAAVAQTKVLAAQQGVAKDQLDVQARVLPIQAEQRANEDLQLAINKRLLTEQSAADLKRIEIELIALQGKAEGTISEEELKRIEAQLKANQQAADQLQIQKDITQETINQAKIEKEAATAQSNAAAAGVDVGPNGANAIKAQNVNLTAQTVTINGTGSGTSPADAAGGAPFTPYPAVAPAPPVSQGPPTDAASRAGQNVLNSGGTVDEATQAARAAYATDSSSYVRGRQDAFPAPQPDDVTHAAFIPANAVDAGQTVPADAPTPPLARQDRQTAAGFATAGDNPRGGGGQPTVIVNITVPGNTELDPQWVQQLQQAVSAGAIDALLKSRDMTSSRAPVTVSGARE